MGFGDLEGADFITKKYGQKPEGQMESNRVDSEYGWLLEDGLRNQKWGGSWRGTRGQG